MSRFGIIDTPIAGLKIVERSRQSDERGFFSRVFCTGDLREAGWSKPVAQVNQTLTRRPGAVRGLHFQLPPHAEMKLVNCIRGAVFDVAVDLRRGSPTFLKWFGTELSMDNGRALLIPEGFAHGFQVLAADSELMYFHSTAYHAASESAVHVEDPRVGIAWPRPIAELSARDSAHSPLSPSFDGIAL
ncbi:dTDP-4-dehydrorhamnose 3,5-epimerase [Bradyrhizobium lablabi]|uniref:dTDP-4-dehydrorhamnose 3,5-epimerase n=1 Tax=Bradyrhizobium lablabi TaxID=722472 RepID=UPI001BAA93B2|nr:dTDP-4-dehydrorhamnose 3,5-epimerase [Bradyrhizobium lablabi]MBR1120192.1 dTDP-4-dehydrorhamnose 3,5-epimerase [Bradyrhizobium lablabi]